MFLVRLKMFFHLITLNSFICDSKNILICLNSKETRTQRRCLRSLLTIKRHIQAWTGTYRWYVPTQETKSTICISRHYVSLYFYYSSVFLFLVVWMNLRISCRCIENKCCFLKTKLLSFGYYESFGQSRILFCFIAF